MSQNHFLMYLNVWQLDFFRKISYQKNFSYQKNPPKCCHSAGSHLPPSPVIVHTVINSLGVGRWGVLPPGMPAHPPGGPYTSWCSYRGISKNEKILFHPKYPQICEIFPKYPCLAHHRNGAYSHKLGWGGALGSTPATHASAPTRGSSYLLVLLPWHQQK